MTNIYVKRLFGATMVVSKELEADAKFNVQQFVTERLVKMLEREAERVGGFLDYDTMVVERVEEEAQGYQHYLSRDEQPLWRFVLGLFPLVPRLRETREIPPKTRYVARATVSVPELPGEDS